MGIPIQRKHTPGWKVYADDCKSIKLVGRKQWGLTLEVDPAAFSPDHTYTVEYEGDGIWRRWTGIRPQREEDGTVRVYLPIERH